MDSLPYPRAGPKFIQVLGSEESGGVAGFVAGRRIARKGRRIFALYLAEGRRSKSHFDRFVDRIEWGRRSSPVIDFPDESPGLTDQDFRRTLAPLGYVHLRRRRLRLTLFRTEPEAPASAAVRLRSLEPSDAGSLAHLHEHAYGATIEAAFGPTLVPRRDFAALEEKFLGLRGPAPAILHACWAASVGPRLVGAIIVESRARGARITDLCVEPELQRHGIGAMLLRQSTRSLYQNGFRSVELGATIENPTGSYRFYERRGFVRVPGVAGRIPGLWIRSEFLNRHGFAMASTAR